MKKTTRNQTEAKPRTSKPTVPKPVNLPKPKPRRPHRRDQAFDHAVVVGRTPPPPPPRIPPLRLRGSISRAGLLPDRPSKQAFSSALSIIQTLSRAAQRSGLLESGIRSAFGSNPSVEIALGLMDLGRKLSEVIGSTESALLSERLRSHRPLPKVDPYPGLVCPPLDSNSTQIMEPTWSSILLRLLDLPSSAQRSISFWCLDKLSSRVYTRFHVKTDTLTPCENGFLHVSQFFDALRTTLGTDSLFSGLASGTFDDVSRIVTGLSIRESPVAGAAGGIGDVNGDGNPYDYYFDNAAWKEWEGTDKKYRISAAELKSRHDARMAAWSAGLDHNPDRRFIQTETGRTLIRNTNFGRDYSAYNPATANRMLAPSSAKSAPSMSMASAPTAFGSQGPLVNHQPHIVEHTNTEFGPGLRISGRQFLCNVGICMNPPATPITGSALWAPAANQGCDVYQAGQQTPMGQTVNGPILTPTPGGQLIRVAPDHFNLRIALLSQLFSRWKMEKMHVMYTPSCPTSVVGSMVMAHADDPTIDLFQGVGSFSAITQFQDARINTFWAPSELPIKGHGQWLFQETEGTPNAASLRQCCEGLIAVATDQAPAGGVGSSPNVSMGTLWLAYDIHLADPVPSYGLGATRQLQKSLGKTVYERIIYYLLLNPAVVAALALEVDPQDAVPQDELQVVDTLKRLGMYTPDPVSPLEALLRRYFTAPALSLPPSART